MVRRSNSKGHAPATRMNPHDAWSRRARGWEKWEPILMQALSGVDDLHRLLTSERAGKTIPVTLIRGAHIESLAIVPQAEQ